MVPVGVAGAPAGPGEVKLLLQLGEDRLTLVRVTSRSEELFTRFTKDAKEVRPRIDGLQSSSARGNIFAATRPMMRPFTGIGPRERGRIIR